MELRQYWRIIWRRWWLIVALPTIVLVVSLVTYKPPAAVYQATMEKKQAFLFRTVDIAMEIAVLVATVVRANKMATEGITLAEATDPYIEAFFADLDTLNIERAEQ